MKAATVYLIVFFIFLSLYVQKGVNENCDDFKKGDIVGALISDTFKIAYDVVLKDGISPFGSQEIVEHLSYKKLDFETYKTSVAKYLGNLSPGVTTNVLARGDIIGAVLPNSGITYRVVVEDGVYPFENETMLIYYNSAFPDYKANVEKYLGESAPGWVTKMADDLQQLYYS